MVHIGQTHAERLNNQEIFIDLEAEFEGFVSSDDVKDAINYDELHNVMKIFTEEKEYKLIETLAEKIAQKILSQFPITKVQVFIKKPQAIKSVKYAGVKVVRHG